MFTCNPDHPSIGALFGLGANYYQVGRITGQMAADILKGQKPAIIPIKDVVPKKLILNLAALKGLKGDWSVPGNILSQADSIIH